MSVLLLLALSVGTALAGEPSAAQSPTPSPSPILPPQFAGWHVSGTIQSSKDPAVADSVNAALLKEYGLTDFESGTYTRDDGRKLTIKAIRFADASGAYGAFTYYKLPQMLKRIDSRSGCIAQRACPFLSWQHPGGCGVRKTQRHVRRLAAGTVAGPACARAATLAICPACRHIFPSRVM